MNHKLYGFTLIELMLAVAIMGLLMVIAVPQYQEQVRKARRADAKTALLGVAQLQEAYYAEYHRYANKFGTTNNPTEGELACKSSCIEPSGSTAKSPKRYYQLEVSQDNTQTFTLTATAMGDQIKDKKCQVFLLDAQGRKGAGSASATINEDNNSCW